MKRLCIALLLAAVLTLGPVACGGGGGGERAAPDTTAPTSSGSNPADSDTGIPMDTAISITFSEPMDSASVSSAFSVVETVGSTPVSGTVVYTAATNTAVFTPSGNFNPLTSHTVTVDTTAEDAAGNPLGSPVTWSFTTGTMSGGSSDWDVMFWDQDKWG